jgi:hypothetical protein
MGTKFSSKDFDLLIIENKPSNCKYIKIELNNINKVSDFENIVLNNLQTIINKNFNKANFVHYIIQKENNIIIYLEFRPSTINFTKRFGTLNKIFEPLKFLCKLIKVWPINRTILVFELIENLKEDDNKILVFPK